ncbi:MAG TPA: 1-phosphofructokinase family hexose kinase [Bacteroidota bacterium]|nr:1-phosphofructokinase family hexose kinase [Bacteroidota bacterium]
MITTVTLNPMLDKTVSVASIRRGAISRAQNVGMIVGGKGVNVSRQLRHLGDETTATGFLGGEIGTLIERLLDEEGIPRAFVRTGGMTREGVTYLEPDGTQTSVFEPPGTVSDADVERLIAECTSLAARSAWMVCSGSSPAPVADDLFKRIIAQCKGIGVRVALDSYGKALERGIDSVPDFLKPNREEFEQTFGTKVRGETDLIRAARMLIERGVRYALVTDGPRPFAAADAEGAWLVTPPAVKSVNQTGSGDSMVAGILHGLVRSWPFADCLAFGAAAGAANARVWAVASSTPDDIQSLVPAVKLKKV